MSISNRFMILRMFLDRRIIKLFVQVYFYFRKDRNFTLKRYINGLRNVIKGEKIIKFNKSYITNSLLIPSPSKAVFTGLKAFPDKNTVFTHLAYAEKIAPLSIYLCITTKCHNNCVYCSTKNRVETRQELTTREWIKVINELQDMNVARIDLTGGDPLLHEGILDIVSAIDDRSISCLFTTGRLATYDKLLALKRRGLFGLGVGLDSYKGGTTTKGATFSSLRALNYAREVGLYTIAHAVVLKEDVEEEKLFNLFRLVKGNGAHEIRIFEPVLCGGLLTYEKTSDVLYDKATREKLIDIQQKANDIKDFPKISVDSFSESKDKLGCNAGIQHSHISATGDLYPCDFLPMSFGNVRDYPIKELWVNMHKAIGKPRTYCFAQKAGEYIYNKYNHRLPLNASESIEVCKKFKSDEFPGFYKALQGCK